MPVRPIEITGIDQLRNNPLYQIQISIPRRKEKNKSLFNSVRGFVVDNFSIGGDSKYTDLLESGSDQQAYSKLSQYASFAGQSMPIISKAMAALGVDSSQGGFIQHISQTISFYNGTEKPRFDLSLVFVATNECEDPRIYSCWLYDCVYPTISDKGMVVSPLGYSPGFNKVDGTVSIRIGKWFQASHQIITSVQTDYSKQVSSYGFPIYCKVKLSFTPYKLPSADVIKSYLVGTLDYDPETSPVVPLSDNGVPRTGNPVNITNP